MSDNQPDSLDTKLGVAGSAVWTQTDDESSRGVSVSLAETLDRNLEAHEVTDRNPVDALADEFAARIRNGEQPSIDEFVQRLPEYEAAIRVLFPSIAMMERVSHQEHAESRLEQQTVRLTGAVPQTLGDFRILREIGRGGMGIVYEAEQRSLGRRVALKVVNPTSAGTANQLARFQREAEAAARLHHTNIVPVFGIGEDNGLHYFAMQLIEGVPLSDFIESTRSAQATPTQRQNESADHSGNQFQAQPTATSVAIASADVDSDALPPTVERPCAEDDLVVRNGRATPQTDVSKQAHPVGTAQNLFQTAPTGGNWPSLDHFRRVAAMVRDVASALSYAHRNGVLHRDVKPANLILDRAGVVWMTDFGLARRDDHDNVTQTGDIVGTLRYMAPEQFSGDADERSDICSLGLTLFELLTLTPACPETRHGPLIKARTESSPPAPRSVDPTIPVELDTIAQKAAALSPDDRYQTADELADDLQRFLDDRPISARRMWWHERVRRWARRNPAVAALSVTAAILLIAVAVTFAIGRHQAEEALGVAETQRTRAEKNLALAVEAFEEIIDNIAARGVSPSLAATAGEGEVAIADSVLTVADVSLLESLLEFFDRFATENDSGTARVDAVAARKRVADIQQRLGRFEEANATYQQSLEAYTALAAEFPGNSAFVISQADILNEMAVSASRRTDIVTASALHESARELLEQTPAVTETESGRFELARTLTLFASIGQRAGLRNLFDAGRPDFPGRGPAADNRTRRPERGPVGKDSGRPGRKPPGLRDPGEDRRGRRGGGRPGRDDGVRGPGPGPGPETGRMSDAARRAVDLLTALVSDFPDNTTYRLWLARAYRAQSGMRFSFQDHSQTAAALKSAVNALARLSEEHPDQTELKFELADMLCMPISMRADAETRKQAVSNVEQAIAICQELTTAYPNSREFQALHGTALSRLASLQQAADDTEAAAATWHSALEIQRPLAARFPGVTLYRVACAQSLQQVAQIERQLGNDAAAEQHLQEAIALLEETQLTGDLNRFLDRFIDRLESRKAESQDI